jgi:hypothetical protein
VLEDSNSGRPKLPRLSPALSLLGLIADCRIEYGLVARFGQAVQRKRELLLGDRCSLELRRHLGTHVDHLLVRVAFAVAEVDPEQRRVQ